MVLADAHGEKRLVEMESRASHPRGVTLSSETPRRSDQAVLQGTVETLTFHNEETGFVVLKVTPETGYGDPEGATWMFPSAAAVGRMEHPNVGARVRLGGRWTRHATHGRRFEFDSVEMLEPASNEGLIKYLSSGAFPGIGEVTARRIVEKLGIRALDRIRNEPDALAEIAALKKKTRDELAAAVRAQFVDHQQLAFLRGVGLHAGQARSVLAKWGDECEAIVRRDPYALSDVVAGIGFATADRIARTLGLAADSRERCRAGILHVLREASGGGHTYLPRARLLSEATELLEPAPTATIAAELDELARAGRIVIEPVEGREPAVYSAGLFAAETELAKSIQRIVEAGEARALADRVRLLDVERENGLELDEDQRAAVLGLLRHPIALLTGGPGVGKTTIVRSVVALAERSSARVLLASPTGRAARRLAEATGREAKTIHRMLAFDPKTGDFQFNAAKPLPADLVIVDEISMLDTTLAARLFAAIEAPTRVVLVGDPNQLPSVGPGHVLHDLIECERLPVFRLRRIYRQKIGGRIVENAHRILKGEMPELPPRGDLGSDFYFFAADDGATAADLLIDVVTERIPENFELDWTTQVQVLAPMYRGECGVDALNERLRAKLAPNKDVGLFGEALATSGFRPGDRVIQTRNDYEKDVFNGDMGHVAQVARDGSVWVRFPDREIVYTADQRTDLQLAFAITVHRAQGSEYDAVVMPLVTQHLLMLRRNLLYTAVTRARRLLVLVGSRRALELAISNAEEDGRLARLAERLEQGLRRAP